MTSPDDVTRVFGDVGVKRHPQYDSVDDVDVEHEAVQDHGELHPLVP